MRKQVAPWSSGSGLFNLYEMMQNPKTRKAKQMAGKLIRHLSQLYRPAFREDTRERGAPPRQGAA